MTFKELPKSLSDRLLEIAQARPQLDVTQLQIINLEDVREAYGDKWPEVRVRVFETSINFLKNRITPEDLLIPCGNGFIIVFGSIEGTSAEIAGLQLARALNNFFVGEEGLEHFRFRCKHQTLEIAGIANLVRALSAIVPSEPITGTLAEEDTNKISFKFQPLWDAKHEALSTYRTRAYDAKGQPLDNDDHDGAYASGRGKLAHDLASIATSVSALERLLKQGDQAIIAMTLHASTLADTKQLSEILQTLEAINHSMRRYLMIILGDVVHGYPRYHLDENVRLLTQKIERVAIELSFDEPDIQSISASPAWALGYPIPRLQHPLLAASVTSVASRVQRDAKQATKHGKRLIIGCDGEPTLVPHCRAAGADYIGCRDLWPALNFPRSVQRAELPSPAAA